VLILICGRFFLERLDSLPRRRRHAGDCAIILCRLGDLHIKSIYEAQGLRWSLNA
jgi:hypothetical protein